MKTIFTFILAVFMAFGAVAQNVGDNAPDFTLKDLSNNNFKLSDKEGEVVFIFWVGHSCPFCIASAPSVKTQIVDAFSNNSKFNAVVIDVWNGSTSSVQGFKNQTGINATFLQDGSSVAASYSIIYDRLLVVDGDGKIAFKGLTAAQSDVGAAKSVVQESLDKLVTTSATLIQDLTGNELGQNFPNPVVDKTKIRFSISEANQVQLSVFDITGKMVDMPVNGYYQGGEHEVELNRRSLPDGIYLYQVRSGNFTATRRMILKQ